MPKLVLIFSVLLRILFLPEYPATPNATLPADKPLQASDIVYVHAPNGLTLRKTAAKDGAKVALVPFDGSPLTVLSPPEPGVLYTAETIGAFAVKGGWVNVKTKTGQEGYLFEGYLSRYKPLNTEKIDGEVSMIDAFYRTISPVKGKRTTLPKKEGTIERYQYVYTDGARFEEQQYEGGITQFLELPKEKFTMPEVLVLFRALWFQKEKTTATFDAAKQRLTLDSEGGYSQLIIQPKGNLWSLQFSTAD
ncbi:SH3 domain-containing protein [Spirosoma sp. BT702]|uniref:SH3 domain-containing protein n=1 Tax=Spirosoma profusum TaxID=2771354 RepID=A0A926Y0D1_9BACT|nr:SH3 domain-containing protein [Spirosoma profusum]MBD2701193.1 SH3 domain-containing protein [Spirosoma profusum]